MKGPKNHELCHNLLLDNNINQTAEVLAVNIWCRPWLCCFKTCSTVNVIVWGGSKDQDIGKHSGLQTLAYEPGAVKILLTDINQQT